MRLAGGTSTRAGGRGEEEREKNSRGSQTKRTSHGGQLLCPGALYHRPGANARRGRTMCCRLARLGGRISYKLSRCVRRAGVCGYVPSASGNDDSGGRRLHKPAAVKW